MTTRRTLLGGLAALAMATTGAIAQEVTLKMHQFLPAQANVPAKILYVWADNVEKASEGRIKIDRFPSMQLGGKPPELYDQAVDGVADLIWTVVGYTPGRFPRTEVFELPFFVNDAKAASSAFWQMYEKHMKDDFSDTHILGTWVHGPGAIHASEQILEPADMNGLKFRGASRQVNALLQELGAEPVGMPVPRALSFRSLRGAPWQRSMAPRGLRRSTTVTTLRRWMRSSPPCGPRPQSL